MSMFREHWVGGLTAYSIFFIISLVATVTVSILYGFPFDWNPTISLDPLLIIGCFSAALLFGLFPDVDIKSKSQKIFYSVLFVFNFCLIFFLHRYIESAILGLIAMLPILSKHRGWTHSRISMLLLPSLFIFVPIYVEYPNWPTETMNWTELYSSLLAWDRFPDILRGGFAFYLAALVGYASHLYLDGILFRFRKRRNQKTR